MPAGERLFATTPGEIIEGLRKIAPSVAISVSWEHDPYHSWDGEGPSPREEGYSPHNVTVTAKAIVDGEEKEGSDHLGGVWEKPGERDPGIHGYFPQMVDGALSELYRSISGRELKTSRKHWDPTGEIAGREGILGELRNAIKFTNLSMKEIYELQMREHARRERRRR